MSEPGGEEHWQLTGLSEIDIANAPLKSIHMKVTIEDKGVLKKLFLVCCYNRDRKKEQEKKGGDGHAVVCSKSYR